MYKKQLQRDQLNARLQAFREPSKLNRPDLGWIKTIRTTLGISLQQLGKKIGITKQSMLEMEQREAEGSITLNALQEVAKAMDMQLVYGFVPKDGSLDALIERKANETAERIVSRVSKSMKLEDQENSETRIKKAIRERASTLKDEVSKIIWD
jgi:predicted DNA-binding mobile mystery protein A